MPNKINVLLVEDSEIAQKVAKMTLLGLGCSVDVAEDGQKALNLFNENKYDLIFMDLGLPDIDGVEVTRRIRETEKEGKHVPIVALTANSGDSYREACFSVGMDDFLGKPLTKAASEAMLSKFVKFDN